MNHEIICVGVAVIMQLPEIGGDYEHLHWNGHIQLIQEHLLRGEQENICSHSSAILDMSNIAVKCPLSWKTLHIYFHGRLNYILQNDNYRVR